jgi:hypothetical protein
MTQTKKSQVYDQLTEETQRGILEARIQQWEQELFTWRSDHNRFVAAIEADLGNEGDKENFETQRINCESTIKFLELSINLAKAERDAL